MLAIKSNLMADVAARHLGTSYASLAKSVERLSSGLRINSAKDDAAGLAVRELIRADIATLRQGARNADDAISMLQTAEGATGMIDDNLVRMKELAEQAATGSYSSDQRTLMNQEFQQLAKEISRIAETTDFNGIKLLSTTNQYEIHVGSTDTSGPNKINVQGSLMDAGTLQLSGKRESAVYNTTVGTTSADLFTVTGDGTLTFTFGLDTKDDGTTPVGAVTVNVTTAGGAGSGVSKYTLGQVVDLVNAASRGIAGTSGYNAASINYDAGAGVYSLKVSSYQNGNMTDLVIAGTATITEGIQTEANWTTTSGSSTGQSIATQNGAITALGIVGQAIVTKDTFRARLGHLMNRLEAASSVVTIQAENLQTAESRISDVDVAKEMAAMTRNQVLAQAGVAMLTQANTMPQMALQLLKG